LLDERIEEVPGGGGVPQHGPGGLDDLLARAGDQDRPAGLADDERGRALLGPGAESEQGGRSGLLCLLGHRSPRPASGIARGRVSSSISDWSSAESALLPAVSSDASDRPITSTASTTTTLTLSRPPPSRARRTRSLLS